MAASLGYPPQPGCDLLQLHSCFRWSAADLAAHHPRPAGAGEPGGPVPAVEVWRRGITRQTATRGGLKGGLLATTVKPEPWPHRDVDLAHHRSPAINCLLVVARAATSRDAASWRHHPRGRKYHPPGRRCAAGSECTSLPVRFWTWRQASAYAVIPPTRICITGGAPSALCVRQGTVRDTIERTD